jgi:transcriptional regulator with XRE-family HTH domain
MALKDNLKRHREAADLSQAKLAKAARVSQQLISRLESGADLTTKKLPEIARALSVSVSELDENYASDDGTIAVSAPLISWVRAGELKKPEVPVTDFADARWVSSIGLDPAGQWIALKVDGDSMDRISPPDSVVFVNLKDRRLVANACYVIEDEEGKSTYKRYRPDPARWEPVSTNKKLKPYILRGDRGPRVIGRVKRTVLDL